MTSLYMGFQIYSLTKRLVALSTFVGLHCDCPLARRKKYEPPLKQILVTASPKEAGAFEAPGQTKEELCANDTSRHPKVFKLGTEHGCQ